MRIKRRLQNYKALVLEAQHLADKILEARLNMYNIKSSSDMSIIPTAPVNADKIGALVAKMQDNENMYLDMLAKLEDEKVFIENLINNLTHTEKLLMRTKYIDGETWETVCMIIGYSWKHTHRLHSQILQKLEQG